MQNMLDNLKHLLHKDQLFISDGAILKNAVIEAALNMDARLLELLMQSDTIKAHFFTSVAGALVFDKVKFQDFVSNKQFLPDSYTAFKNRIGLTDGGGDYLRQSGDVVLAWPYKDCVLEGGMTKEDRGRNEVFWNTTLAPDDITRLFEPKVLTGWERWDEEAVTEGKAKPVGEVSEDDNLLIKGNNLLALHSLKARYASKVKLIYIDPPYNTEKDSFRYNDRFSHSTWLTFMKNRLEAMKTLLRRDGVMAAQADENSQAMLKLLMDEVIGRENFLATFFVQARYESKTLSEDNDYQKVMEVVHIYARDAAHVLVNKIEEEYSLEKFCWRVVELSEPTTEEINGRRVDIFKKGQYRIEKVPSGIDALKETWATGSLVRQGGTAAEFLDKYLIERKPKDGLEVLYKVHGMGEDGLGYRYISGPRKATATRGKFYSGVPQKIKSGVEAGEYNKKMPIPNLIYNFLKYEGDFGNCRHEGGIPFGAGKKPERLMAYLVDYFSSEGQLVLDPFSGSGSMIATAIKLKRQSIGIEQLDYARDLPKSRLCRVIGGDKTGVSVEYDWQGGGSFVYTELAASNAAFVELIEAAPDMVTLQTIHADMQATGYLRYDVDLSAFDTDDFGALPLKDAKRVLMNCLDANHLYVNLGSLGDADFDISDEDARATRSFYGLDQ